MGVDMLERRGHPFRCVCFVGSVREAHPISPLCPMRSASADAKPDLAPKLTILQRLFTAPAETGGSWNAADMRKFGVMAHAALSEHPEEE